MFEIRNGQIWSGFIHRALPLISTVLYVLSWQKSTRVWETIKKALETYQEALQYSQNPADKLIPLNNMGNIYCRMHMLDKAEACFQEALSVNPNFTRASLGLGSTYFLSGKVTDAIREYKKSP